MTDSTEHQPAAPNARRLQSAAVRTALRRLARAEGTPWLHREVAQRMGERLQVIKARPELIVDWWGGVGAGAEVLTAAYPGVRRMVVEPDRDWVDRSTRASGKPWWSLARWRAAAIEVVDESDAIAGPAQLVWANMMIHAADDPPALFARWNRLLAVEGFVMFSCLGPATLQELRELYASLGWPAPTAAFIDMHDLGDMLVEAGFAAPVMDQELLTIRWTSPEKLIHDLRALGGNASTDRIAGLRTPRWRVDLLRALESLRGDDGTIAMTFEVAYGHGFKVAQRVRSEGAATTISLDDMRAMVRERHADGSSVR